MGWAPGCCGGPGGTGRMEWVGTFFFVGWVGPKVVCGVGIWVRWCRAKWSRRSGVWRGIGALEGHVDVGDVDTEYSLVSRLLKRSLVFLLLTVVFSCLSDGSTNGGAEVDVFYFLMRCII